MFILTLGCVNIHGSTQLWAVTIFRVVFFAMCMKLCKQISVTVCRLQFISMWYISCAPLLMKEISRVAGKCVNWSLMTMIPTILLKYLFFNYTLHVNNLAEKNRIIHRHCCLDCGNIEFKA